MKKLQIRIWILVALCKVNIEKVYILIQDLDNFTTYTDQIIKLQIKKKKWKSSVIQ